MRVMTQMPRQGFFFMPGMSKDDVYEDGWEK